MKANKSKTATAAGFTLVEIMIVVVIIGLLASMAIPSLNKSRATATQKICINNLTQIDGAKSIWQLEQHKGDNDTPAGSDLQPYLGRGSGGTLPSCPSDGAQTFATSYNPQNMSTKPVCLIVPTSHVLP
jgi:prepilin-type N-terminal cleavage/methylation domain-containing protein